MQPTDTISEGTTWDRPARRSTRMGTTWLVAMLLSVAMLAGLTAGSATTAETASADVGTLSPSSHVEMLLVDPGTTVATLDQVRQVMLRDATIGDGTGIDVAIIDTGIAPVDGLVGEHKVIYGPDLSGEAADPAVAHLDTFGHGTHMAGIIAGDRAGASGVAPGARLVSLKVAGRDGITTVPQVIAAIDWVVEHRNQHGLNIRVLNLSLGQQGVSDHFGDYLSAAVERAWDAGIFVVVAAGNDGENQPHLDSPAIDPYVVAVAAADSLGSTRTRFFNVPSWSAQGDGNRNPDVSGLGRTIASYRVPGSALDELAPYAVHNGDLFLGSGTSQAAASVSGAAAAILSSHPYLTNDDLKATMMRGADDLRHEPEVRSGKGVVDAQQALKRPKYDVQYHVKANGAGSGIVTPSTATWTTGTWTTATWTNATWTTATWTGGEWSAAGWSNATWTNATWTNATWTNATWTTATWTGTWQGDGWG